MANSKAIPSLSTQGWLTDQMDPTTLTSKLLSYFVVAEYSQTNAFYGSITSLAYIISQYGNDELRFREVVSRELERMFGRYFDSVSVTAQTKDTVDEQGRTNGFDVELTIEQMVDGKRVNLAYRLENRRGDYVVIQREVNGE